MEYYSISCHFNMHGVCANSTYVSESHKYKKNKLFFLKTRRDGTTNSHKASLGRVRTQTFLKIGRQATGESNHKAQI